MLKLAFVYTYWYWWVITSKETFHLFYYLLVLFTNERNGIRKNKDESQK